MAMHCWPLRVNSEVWETRGAVGGREEEGHVGMAGEATHD